MSKSWGISLARWCFHRRCWSVCNRGGQLWPPWVARDLSRRRRDTVRPLSTSAAWIFSTIHGSTRYLLKDNECFCCFCLGFEVCCIFEISRIWAFCWLEWIIYCVFRKCRMMILFCNSILGFCVVLLGRNELDDFVFLMFGCARKSSFKCFLLIGGFAASELEGKTITS